MNMYMYMGLPNALFFTEDDRILNIEQSLPPSFKIGRIRN